MKKPKEFTGIHANHGESGHFVLVRQRKILYYYNNILIIFFKS